MKRLFAFGCSFTRYRWPTWADIIAANQSYALYENWGFVGGGNLFIFNSIIECNLRHKFTKNDEVFVMWSTTHRMDLYNNHIWQLQGASIEQGKNYNDQRGYYIRDLALIAAIDQIISPIGCNFQMMSMVNLRDHKLATRGASGKVISGNSSEEDCDDVVELYSEVLNKIHPSMHEVVYNHDWKSRPQHAKKDFHPGPLLHLEYLDKIFGDDYISANTRMTIEEWNKTYPNGNLCDWTSPGAHAPKRF